jgi:hypothetical protein
LLKPHHFVSPSRRHFTTSNAAALLTPVLTNFQPLESNSQSRLVIPLLGPLLLCNP